MGVASAINSPSSSLPGGHDRLSYCILWSPLPVITWVLPFIGHLGIADSRGIASDFQGPYFVGDQGRMAFGTPTRALKVNLGTLSRKCHNLSCRKFFCHTVVAFVEGCDLSTLSKKTSKLLLIHLYSLIFLNLSQCSDNKI